MRFLPLLLLGCAAAPATEIYVFVGPECPVSNFYAPEIQRLGSAAGAVLVYPDATQDEARAHAEAYKLTLPRRVGRELADRLDVRRIPTAVVVRDGTVVYRGRIDDRWSADGRRRTEPTTKDFEEALSAVAAGRNPPRTETPVHGCPLEARR